VGNVVTGQGNIRVSLIHSQKVTKQLIDDFMSGSNGGGTAGASAATAETRAAGQAQAVHEGLLTIPALSPDRIAALEQRIRARQERVGYTSDYDSWIAKVTPPDLE
jgi:hypothetical protein